MIDGKAVALLCGALLLFSCTQSHDTRVDGQTHFLTQCDEDGDCGGLDCICGVCTKTCASAAGCEELGEGVSCLEPAELGARECGTGKGEPVDQSVCDATCTEDSGCNSLGDAHACYTGYCRAPKPGSVSRVTLCQDEPPSQSSCLVSGVIADVDVKKVEKVDLLFVIENSLSMQEEQQKLRSELPRMIRILTSGDLNPDDNGGIPEDNKDFPAARDLHLAVVSTDMGLPGVTMSLTPGGECEVGLGDDGLFQSAGNQALDPGLVCQPSYPLFLSFQTGNNPDAIASDFQCVSALGTGGCTFEMPLESALKALWPANPGNLDESQQSLDIQFFGNSPSHGDQQHIEFLRGTSYHPTQSEALSLLAIIVVADQPDCSAGANGNLDFLEHPNYAPPGIGDQPASLRCYFDTVNDQGNKFPVERYINGFKALRPGYEQLVVFGAITGVPPDINVYDFDADADALISQTERDAYYQILFNDPRMQERIRADAQSLELVCTVPNPLYDPNDPNSEQFSTRAWPTRRIVEVAQGFGENGVVQSICEESFATALDPIIQAISKQLGGVCLPRKLRRNANGLVECDVVWGMPGGRGCDLPFLSPPPADQPQTGGGKNRCVVEQVPVIDPAASDPSMALEPGRQGWYYDDFSAERLRDCKGDPENLQRIAFTLFTGVHGEATADPPEGATVELRCLNEIWGPPLGEDSPEGMVGYECDLDGECGGSPMRCHPQARTCVIGCASDAECPNAWICDTELDTVFAQQAGFALCFNPICDSPEGEARNCGNSDVGKACIPQNIPADGFRETEVYLETNAPGCETRICGVFKYVGDPRQDDPRVVEDRVYCTCRCAAPDNSSTCQCPDGFQCVDVLDLGGPGIRGSYCVRNGQW